MFIERFPGTAKQMLRNGLLIGNGIGIDAYEEIFSNNPRAGTQMREAHEDVDISPETQEMVPATMVSIGDREGNKDDDFKEEDPYQHPLPLGDDIDKYADKKEDSAASTAAAQEISSTPAPRRRFLSKQARGASSTPSRGGSSSSTPPPRGSSVASSSYRVTSIPPNRAASLKPRERRKQANISQSSNDLVEAFSRLAERENRLLGAGDVEKALLDCQELLQEEGEEDLDLIGQVAAWFSASLMRAVTWNTLKSEDIKRRIIEREFSSR